ncbi:MAG: YARHG domain-containing protein [Synergistaceae bacterium]|jgi:hypothetical protein|nr:YARHG domain-containing protein [Synergistaceae bacterium]
MMKKIFAVALIFAAVMTMAGIGAEEAGAAERAAKGIVLSKGADDPLEGLPPERLSTENLSKAELKATSTENLAYLRNRIYANHGYVFKTKKWIDEFSNSSWYQKNPKFSEKLFNSYEKKNLKNIIGEEKKREKK